MASRTLTVEIVGDASSLSRGFHRASVDVDKSMGNVQGSVKKHSHGISKSMVGVGAAIAAVGAGIRTLKQSVGTIETLAKGTAMVSRTTGLDNKEASEWVTLAKVRGVEAKQLNIGFVSLARNIRAGTDHTSKAAKAFKELGVSHGELKRGNASEIIRKVSDSLAKMPDGANKAALAQQLFGKQTATLLPLLNKGSGELNKQLGIVDKYGASLDKHGVKQAQKAVDAQRELGIAWQGAQIVLAQKVIPFITKAASAFAGFVSSARRAIGPSSSFGKAWREAAVTVGVAVGKAASWVKGAFSDITSAVRGFSTRNRSTIRTAAEAFENVGKAARALARAVVWAFQTILLPIIRTTVRAMGRVLDGLKDTLSGLLRFVANTLTGRWGKAWDGLKDTVKGALRTMVSSARGFVEIIASVAYHLGGAIVKGMIKGLAGLETKIANKIKGALKSAAGTVGGWIDKANPFSGITGNIGDGIGKKIGDGIGAGGVLPSGGAFGGDLMGARTSMRPFAAIGSRFGLNVSSGRRPGSITSSGNISYHSSGEAIDMADGRGPDANKMSFFKYLKSHFGGRIAELIYGPAGVGIKDGRAYNFGPKLNAQHMDHVHVALDTGKPGVGDAIGRVAAAAKAAGFGGQDLIEAVAIAGAETGGSYNPGATNFKPPDHSIGPWQINQLAHHGRFGSDAALKNLTTNARAARALFKESGFHPWSTFPTAAKAYLARARKAVVGLGGARAGGGGGLDNAIANVIGGTPPRGGGIPARSGGSGGTDYGTGGYTQGIANVGVEKATATAHDSLPAMIKALGHEKTLKRRRLKKINRTLKRRIKRATRATLTDEKAQLITDLAEINGLLKEYRADAAGGATTITGADELTAGVPDAAAGGGGEAEAGPTPMDFANAAIAEAGLTPGLGDDIKATSAALDIATGDLAAARASGDPRRISEAIGVWTSIHDSLVALKTSVDDTGQAMRDHTAALQDVHNELKRSNDIAHAIQSTDNFQLTKFLSDTLGGFVVGRGVVGRSFTPGTGVEHAY